MTPLVLTRQQVGEVLRLSPRTIRRYELAGQWPLKRLPGRRVRYAAAAVEAYLKRFGGAGA